MQTLARTRIRLALALAVVGLAALVGACEPAQKEAEPAKLDDEAVVAYVEGLDDSAKRELIEALGPALAVAAAENTTRDEPTAEEGAASEPTTPSADAVAEEPAVAEVAAPPAENAPPVVAAAEPETVETTDVIARGDKGLTILGTPLEVGAAAPDFLLTDTGMSDVKLSDYAGKWVIVSVVPSLDTPICELQTGNMVARQADMPENAKLITVSRDLPFAQKRFIDTHQVETTIASDYKGGSFGADWGLIVKESGLLTRSVWIVDPSGKVAYRQIVRDQATEPDYESVMSALAELTSAG